MLQKAKVHGRYFLKFILAIIVCTHVGAIASERGAAGIDARLFKYEVSIR